MARHGRPAEQSFTLLGAFARLSAHADSATERRLGHPWETSRRAPKACRASDGCDGSCFWSQLDCDGSGTGFLRPIPSSLWESLDALLQTHGVVSHWGSCPIPAISSKDALFHYLVFQPETLMWRICMSGASEGFPGSKLCHDDTFNNCLCGEKGPDMWR